MAGTRHRENAPSVTLAAHDADLIESTDTIMNERYGRFADNHEITYGDETCNWFGR